MCFTFKMLMDLYFGLLFAKKWNMMPFLGMILYTGLWKHNSSKSPCFLHVSFDPVPGEEISAGFCSEGMKPGTCRSQGEEDVFLVSE